MKNKRIIIIASALALLLVGLFAFQASHKASYIVSTAPVAQKAKTVSSSPVVAEPVKLASTTPAKESNLVVVVQAEEKVAPVNKSVVKTNVEVKKVTPKVSITPKPVSKVIIPKVKKSPKPVKVNVADGTTVTTKTESGTQSVSVKTDKVKVTVSPVVQVSPEASPSPFVDNFVDPTLPQAPDWDGFIAPQITFDGIYSCTRSAEKVKGAYLYTLNPTLKWSNGYYKVSNLAIGSFEQIHKLSDIAYDSESYQFMDWGDQYTGFLTPSIETADITVTFKPLNWKVGINFNEGSTTYKSIKYHIVIPYSQKDCK